MIKLVQLFDQKVTAVFVGSTACQQFMDYLRGIDPTAVILSYRGTVLNTYRVEAHGYFPLDLGTPVVATSTAVEEQG